MSEIRAQLVVGDILYLVKGDVFYESSTSYVLTYRGTLSTSTGKVYLNYNGYDIIVVDGTKTYQYVIATTTFTTVTGSQELATFLSDMSQPAFLKGETIPFDATASGFDRYGLWGPTLDRIGTQVIDYGGGIVFTYHTSIVATADITIDGVKVHIDINNFIPSSMANAASVVQTNIRAKTNRSEKVEWTGERFIITSAINTRDSQISFMSKNLSTSHPPTRSGGGTGNTIYDRSPIDLSDSQFMNGRVGFATVFEPVVADGAKAGDTTLYLADSSGLDTADTIAIELNDTDLDDDIPPEVQTDITITGVIGIPAYITGSDSVVEDDVTEWDGISDGAIKFRSDGELYNVTGIDYTPATAMTGAGATSVDTITQTAIRAETSGTETVVWTDGDHFVITSGDSTSDSDIDFFEVQGTGTDISGVTERGTSGKYWLACSLHSATKTTKFNSNGEITIHADDALTGDADAGNKVFLTETLPIFSTSTYVDGLYIATEADSGKMYASELKDGSAWATLDFAEAEADPDDVVRVLTTHRELWALGENGAEPFYNAPNLSFPFQRIANTYVHIGCLAPASAVVLVGFPIWFTDKKQVVILQGYTPKIISTPQVDYQFAQYSTVTDATAYEIKGYEGHDLYILNFPTEDKTWVWDMTTGVWFKWSSGAAGGRHKGNCYSFFNDKHTIGDYTNGKLYQLSSGTYTDDGTAIARKRVFPVKPEGRNPVSHNLLEVLFNNLTSASILLRYSDDDGDTWVSAGTIVVSDEAKWRRIGLAKDRLYEITTSTGENATIYGAHLNES